MNCISWRRNRATDVDCTSFVSLATPYLLYGASHYSEPWSNSVDATAEFVRQDLADSGISFDEFRNAKILLDFRAEGQNDKDILYLVYFLRQQGVKQFAVLFSSLVDTRMLDYPAASMTTSLANHLDWFGKLQKESPQWHVKSDFLCLIRRPNHSRARFASELVKQNIDLKLSFGSMFDSPQLKNYQPYFMQPLPFILDGPLPTYGTELRQHTVTHDLLRSCAVNIIVETSTQTSKSWRSTLLTEKTFKAFGMLQVPIWWAVPGTVKLARSLGFDVFDNIIDHGYDDVQDESLRQRLVIEQINHLNLQQPKTFRQRFPVKLQHNYNTLNHYIQNDIAHTNNVLINLGFV